MMSAEKILNEQQSEIQELLQQGQVLLGAEKYEEAIQYFDKVISREPMNQPVYISKGIAYANLERLPQATDCFTKAMMIDKNKPDPYLHLGNMAFLEQKFELGIKHYNQAISLGYTDAVIYYNLGLIYEQRDEYEMAIRYYGKAAFIDELNPVYRIRKATVQLMLGQNKEALQTLEDLRRICPESFDAYHLAAAAHTMLGEYDEADKILELAESMFPDDREIIFDRIRTLVIRGDTEQALARLDALKTDCESTDEKKEILLNLAKIYGQKDDINSAISALEEALAIREESETDPEIRYILSNAYLSIKQYDKLLQQAGELEKLGNSNIYGLCAKYYIALANKMIGTKDYEKQYRDAIRYYRNITLADPSKIEAYLFRAMCLKDLGEYDKALETIDYVLLLQPENGQLHVVKGNVYKEMGEHNAEAEAEYKLAKSLGNVIIPGIQEA